MFSQVENTNTNNNKKKKKKKRQFIRGFLVR